MGNTIMIATKSSAGSGKIHRAWRSIKLPDTTTCPLPRTAGPALRQARFRGALLRLAVEQRLELAIGLVGGGLEVLALDRRDDDGADDVAGLAHLDHEGAVVGAAASRQARRVQPVPGEFGDAAPGVVDGAARFGHGSLALDHPGDGPAGRPRDELPGGIPVWRARADGQAPRADAV